MENALLSLPIRGRRLAIWSVAPYLWSAVAEKSTAMDRPASARRKAPAQFQLLSGEKIGWYAFVVAFKGVVLEGLEIAFIVVTFGAEANQIGTTAGEAVAALVVVGGVAFLIRGWLSRISREWLRFTVGLLLAVFGTFWTSEGARVRWRGGNLSLLDSWQR
jgi:high-affinity Fe2+/Pb2+ permease